MSKNYLSVLKMEDMFFDKISFERKGPKNDDKELLMKFQCQVYKRETDGNRKISLTFFGTKENEYDIEITLTAFFSFSADEEISEEFKDTLMDNNAVAIMMPYIRSQISLLTAQPKVDCVVLPPFNINNLLE